jgi:hypothetical protein
MTQNKLINSGTPRPEPYGDPSQSATFEVVVHYLQVEYRKNCRNTVK